MTTKASLLDRDVPHTGLAADAFSVAQTAIMLRSHAGPDVPHWQPARHAVTLHRISGWLHRISERQCSEDLTCHNCQGNGYIQRHFHSKDHRKALPLLGEHNRVDCPRCGGRGDYLGRREARLEREATAIAEHYGLLAYFQGDPRGCSLYLIDPLSMPTTKLDLEGYLYTTERDAQDSVTIDQLQRRWIAANYNRGHAVTRLGR